MKDIRVSEIYIRKGAKLFPYLEKILIMGNLIKINIFIFGKRYIGIFSLSQMSMWPLPLAVKAHLLYLFTNIYLSASSQKLLASSRDSF